MNIHGFPWLCTDVSFIHSTTDSPDLMTQLFLSGHSESLIFTKRGQVYIEVGTASGLHNCSTVGLASRSGSARSQA